MLDIGRIAGAGVAYYVRGVVEDVAGPAAANAPGCWLGGGALGLGLGGTVEPGSLREVLDGRDPRTGSTLHAGPRRLSGRDLVLRPPKSVSLVYGLAEGSVSTAVADAHGRAAAGAIGYLDRALVGAATRTQGPVPADAGLVAAAFCHTTSRADDPLLHTHAVTANLTRLVDGTWAGLDGLALFAHARAAAALYQAALRHELTRELGVRWRPVDGGIAEIDGVPSRVVRAFSRRRGQIEAAVGAGAERSARAALIATLETRPSASGAGVLDLRETWRSRALELGFGPRALHAVLHRAVHDRAAGAELDQAARAVLVTAALDELGSLSSFDRRDVVRTLCARLPSGAPVEVVEHLADGVLAGHDVIEQPARRPASQSEVFRARSGHLVAVLAQARRYASATTLRREASFVVRSSSRGRSRRCRRRSSMPRSNPPAA